MIASFRAFTCRFRANHSLKQSSQHLSFCPTRQKVRVGDLASVQTLSFRSVASFCAMRGWGCQCLKFMQCQLHRKALNERIRVSILFSLHILTKTPQILTKIVPVSYSPGIPQPLTLSFPPVENSVQICGKLEKGCGYLVEWVGKNRENNKNCKYYQLQSSDYSANLFSSATPASMLPLPTSCHVSFSSPCRFSPCHFASLPCPRFLCLSTPCHFLVQSESASAKI